MYIPGEITTQEAQTIFYNPGEIQRSAICLGSTPVI